MATVNIKTNIAQVAGRLRRKLSSLNDGERLLRPVCLDVIDLMTKRIHIDGLASDNRPIGTYSENYMKLRTDSYASDVYTRGPNRGKPRPKYNRNADPKVIISLTSQLENDYGVAATENGYGVGFSNVHNFDKAGWVEETYNKKIFSLAPNEIEHVRTRLAEIIAQILRDE